MGQVLVHGRQVSEQVLILDLQLHQVFWLLALVLKPRAQVQFSEDVWLAIIDLASLVQDSYRR